MIHVGILTVSDRCGLGKALDTSGDNLESLINDGIIPKAKVIKREVCRDEIDLIRQGIASLQEKQVDLILTTGGTGISYRDVTIEAVKSLGITEIPGITTKIMIKSLEVTPFAALSRSVAGILDNKVLIVTLPGSKKASQECLSFISDIIPHAIDLLRKNQKNIEVTHSTLQAEGISSDAFQHCQDRCNHSPSGSKVDISKVTKRPRKSTHRMIEVQEAINIVLNKALVNSTKKVKLTDAVDHVLAEPITSDYPLPPFPASIKDGYAVIAEDGAGLRAVCAASTAGSSPDQVTVSPGMCVRISTGAPVPSGANAVIQVEDTELTKKSTDETEELEINIKKSPKVGQDIRPIGCDISKGQLILDVGTHLKAPEMGLVASVGRNEVLVYLKSTVAVLSTGNEIQEPGTPLKNGYIYDSNKTTLLSYLRQHNIPTYDAGIAIDNPHVMYNTIKKAFDCADILVTTGSVSMGEKDLLRPILEVDFNAEIHFAQVYMKPGKPTTFASCIYKGKRKLILGLPGNPVSATVTAFLYLFPLCMKSSGHVKHKPTTISVQLSCDMKLDPRPEYHRVSLNWESNIPEAISTGNQLSSRLMSFQSADAIIVLPAASEEQKFLSKGTIVQAYLLAIPYN